MCDLNSKFGHNYIAGLCLDCGRSQEVLTYKKEHFAPIKAVSKEVKGEQSEEKDLATEIYEWSGRKLNFGMIRNMIRTKGAQCMRELLSEVKHDECKEPLKMFLWKYKQVKMIPIA